MPVLARWQATIVDGAGNVVPNASIEVKKQVAGLPPAACFANRDGSGSLGSSFQADANGFAAFHVVGGAYQIRAFLGGFERIWNYVGIGRASETDAGLVPITTPNAWLFDDPTADADPGVGQFRLNNANPALATLAYIDNMNSGAVDVSAWLNTLDDTGDSSNRGMLSIFDVNDPAAVFRTYLVSGTVVDGTGYRKVTLTHVAGAGSLVDGGLYAFAFYSRGVTGAGLANVVEDITPQLGGDLDLNGNDITGTGNINIDGAIDATSDISVDGDPVLTTGRHTIWVPAAAMIPRTTNGPALVTAELATNDVMLRTLDFDQTTEEGAQFHIGMPKGWDEGTVTFIPYWTATSGSGGVVWQIEALARSNDDALDTAFGTGQNSADTLIATGDLHVGPESSAITIGGTPAESDDVIFQVTRVTADGGDTLNADAKLIGVKVLFSLAARNDA